MAETITIPSPSVFLRASPTPPDPPPLQLPKQERKRSMTTTNKRKAATTSTAEAKTTDDGAVTKPKQSKSRNGCATCKAKRLKCDETKPGCLQCKRRSVECGGYKKDFKWRPFGETTTKFNPIPKPKKASPAASQVLDFQQTSPLTSPTNDTPPQIDVFKAEKPNNKGKRRASPEQSVSFAQQVFVSPERENANIDPALVHDAGSAASTQAGDERRGSVPTSPFGEPSGSNPFADGMIMQHSMESPDFSTLQPMMDEAGFSGPDAPTVMTDLLELNLKNIDHMDVDLSDFSLAPSLMPGDSIDEDVEEIDRTMPPEPEDDTDLYPLQLAAYSGPRSAVRRGSSNSSLSNFSGPITYLFEQPAFTQDSPEMIMMRFDRLTCGILSVMDGPTENPWRTLIWPMTARSPALYHAVSSMTAFHSSRDIATLRVAGHEHKDASVRYLLQGINENTMELDNAIATTLTLAFAEVWDQHISTGNDHIKGARSLIHVALEKHRQQPLTGVELQRLKFLCNAWVYLDVIARITSKDIDESEDYDHIYSLYSTSFMGPSAGFGIDFGMPIDANLDPLLGCAGTLFPLIGRVANLAHRVRRTSSNSPSVISQAMELKLLLETWDPPAYIESPEDPTSSVQHTLQTAEAYRWATLLYLQQAVPEIPSLPSSEMARKVLAYLATVPLASRTVVVQIFPLMSAGPEADTAEDRQWVRDRWRAMEQRMRLGLLNKCMELTAEVWRRRDTYNTPRSSTSPERTRPAGMQSPQRSAPKRAFSSLQGDDEQSWMEMMGSRQRRMTNRGVAEVKRPSVVSTDAMTGLLDPAYSVRGRLHWLAVMMEWGWEVLLG